MKPKQLLSERIALTHCPVCGSEVSSHAPTCPHCGHPLRLSKSGATMVLALGILSVVFFMYAFLGPLAWALGNRELREIDVGLRIGSGRQRAITGRNLGRVGTFLGAAFYLLLTVALGAGIN